MCEINNFLKLCICIDKLYMGPGQLYQDLQNLIHDLSLVHQISSMISSLKGNYQVLYFLTKTNQYQGQIIPPKIL